MADTPNNTPVATPSTPAANPAPKPAAQRAPKSPPPVTKPTSPVIADAKKRPTLSAKKALGLDESPRESMKKEAEAVRKAFRESTRVTGLTEETPAPAPASPAASTALPDLEAETPKADAAAPATPAPPAKIKVGDKEYTADELIAENQRLADEARRAQAPAPAPVEEQAPPPAPQLTPEQISEREKKFVVDTAGALEAPLTEEEVDTLLAGGKEAVELLTKIRQRDMATAIMHARKGVAQILDPLFNKIFATLQPLEAQHQSIQAYTVEQQFVAKHKDFTPHLATARQVAEELTKRYPKQIAKMTQDQFIDEVARQTDVILSNEHRRWFPQQNGNWRTGSVTPPDAKTAQVAAVAATPAAAPAAAPAAPPAPQRSTRAPAATSPNGGAPAGAQPWGKSVAASLRG